MGEEREEMTGRRVGDEWRQGEKMSGRKGEGMSGRKGERKVLIWNGTQLFKLKWGVKSDWRQKYALFSQA